LCKDPEVIQAWFQLVQNMKAKHGILDKDTYNFDETGFMMGMISTGAVVTGSNSSSSSMVSAFEQLAKGASMVAHRLVLAQACITELEAANEASA
jgi:hypothetical protein